MLARLIEWLLAGWLERFERKQTAFKMEVTSALQAELQRVGKAMEEIQQRVSAIPPVPTPAPDTSFQLDARLTLVERVLTSIDDRSRPGNHIRPGHSFGNKVRL